MDEKATGNDGGPAAPDTGNLPGPDSGLRTPPSSIERGLKEAADALRGVDGDKQGKGDQAPG
jgi:hypothetical protein